MVLLSAGLVIFIRIGCACERFLTRACQRANQFMSYVGFFDKGEFFFGEGNV
jgi:hypothetical protein